MNRRKFIKTASGLAVAAPYLILPRKSLAMPGGMPPMMFGAKAAAGGSFLPSDISGLVGWWRLGVGITGTTNVTAWADQSGNSKNLAYFGGTGPALQGDNTLLFNGTSSAMRTGTSSYSLSLPYSVFIRFKIVTFAVTVMLLGAAGGTNTPAFKTHTTSPNTYLYDSSSGGSSTFTGASVGSYMSVIVQFDSSAGATGGIRVGAGSFTSLSVAAGCTMTNLALGSGDGSYSNIQVAEWGLYNIALTSANRGNLVTYMNGLGV